MGTHATPPPTGWTHLLYLNRDGTYSYWEQDSAASYLIHQGRHTIHRLHPRVSSVGRFLWIEFSGWRGILENNSQHINFVSRDTLEMYPGSGDVFVDDALTDRYVRDSTPPPSSPSTRPPPPRIRRSRPSMYYVDLDSTGRNTLWRLWKLRPISDSEYPRTVRDGYRYRHDQIPGALIGDFDADSIMDVAIYGFADEARAKVVCLLSNGGVPRAAPLLDEAAHPFPDRDRPKPSLYLRLLRAGERAKTLEGTEASFSSDAILVSRPDGYATPYYYQSGSFREGQRVVANRWTINDPR
jgi:hypothetical protein